MKKINIKHIALVGVYVAVMVVLAQFSVPVPQMGAPLTLQVFGVMLAGFSLRPRASVLTVVTYIAIGAVGVPVFSGNRGGASVLFGPTGGFVWGFIILALFCSLVQKTKATTLKICLVSLGFIACHALGAVQYSLVTGTAVLQSFVLVSLPFVLKDIALGVAAYVISLRVKGITDF